MAYLLVNGGTVSVSTRVERTYQVTGVQITKFIFNNDEKSITVSYRKTFADENGASCYSSDEYTDVYIDYVPRVYPIDPVTNQPTNIDPRPACSDYSDIIGKNFTTFQNICEILYGRIREKLNVGGSVVYGTDTNLIK